MSTNGSAKIKPVEGTKIRIMDNGELLELEYDGAMCRHPGSLWWGTAVGYRAMQAAAEALSQERLWDRENLYVVTGHPGPGVQDAVTFVTNVVERGRFHSVVAEGCGMHCNSKMKFDWWVSDGEKTAVIKLRRDFVPREFYELSDRLVDRYRGTASRLIMYFAERMAQRDPSAMGRWGEVARDVRARG